MRIITGTHRGKKLVAAPESVTRPTADRAKEMLFNMIESRLRAADKRWADITFADVFAGSGSMGLEAASRGAKAVWLFENHPVALKFLRQNAIGFDVTIVPGDACRPQVAQHAVDLLFMDPPYAKGLWERALPAFDAAGWISLNTTVIVEVDKTEKPNMPTGFMLVEQRAAGRNTFLWITKAHDEKH